MSGKWEKADEEKPVGIESSPWSAAGSQTPFCSRPSRLSWGEIFNFDILMRHLDHGKITIQWKNASFERWVKTTEAIALKAMLVTIQTTTREVQGNVFVHYVYFGRCDQQGRRGWRPWVYLMSMNKSLWWKADLVLFSFSPMRSLFSSIFTLCMHSSKSARYTLISSLELSFRLTR